MKTYPVIEYDMTTLIIAGFVELVFRENNDYFEVGDNHILESEYEKAIVRVTSVVDKYDNCLRNRVKIVTFEKVR